MRNLAAAIAALALLSGIRSLFLHWRGARITVYEALAYWLFSISVVLYSFQ